MPGEYDYHNDTIISGAWVYQQEIDQLKEQLRQAKLQAKQYQMERDDYMRDNTRVLAELAAANEQRDQWRDLAGVVMQQKADQRERLEEQVRERDQTIADLTKQAKHGEANYREWQRTARDLMRENMQLRASLEAARAEAAPSSDPTRT